MKYTKYLKFPKNQYYQDIYSKSIAVLHHTVSGMGIDGDIRWWEQTAERVATPYIVARDGEITEVFDPKFWAHHLGIKAATLKQYGSNVSNERLNQLSIPIEIDSWGQLVKKGDKFYSYTGQEVPKEKVQIYATPYRGCSYYEKYSTEQIQAVKELLLSLKQKFGIKLYYFPEMFEVSAKALKGYHGIWSHTSYRPDKSDVHPQPELIEMLKSIKEN